jgi:hypothetical protein
MQWGISLSLVFVIAAAGGTVSCSSEMTAPPGGDASTDATGSGGMQPAAAGGRPSGGAGGSNHAGSSSGGATREAGRSPPEDAGRQTPDAAVDSAAHACNEAAAPEPLPVGGSCGADQYLYVDQGCDGPIPSPELEAGVTGTCDDVGDGRCHRRCATDSDCTDPCRPFCSILGLFDGGDYNCNAGVRICREKPKDDCPDVGQLL